MPDASSCWPAARSWLIDLALPLWSESGFSRTAKMFRERLDLHGESVTGAPRRLMVQSRQIYCFATASERSWMRSASELVEMAARSMVRNYFEVDGEPGWIASVDESGHPVDRTRDLYAHAFALFGLASAYRTTGDHFYLAIADKTLAFLDEKMRTETGGYLSFLPYSKGATLLQNPHMHLFEALLTLYENTGKEQYAAKLEEILSLCETRFFQTNGGYLCESFTPEWAPATGTKGRFFEPGHHYEWVWLLRRYSRLLCRAVPPCAEVLMSTASMAGVSPKGLLWSEVQVGGGLIDPRFRLWPHTEAIKAELVQVAGEPSSKADLCLAKLYTTFLRPAHPGGWHDLLDVNGELLSTYMAASSFYHIVCALSEYEEYYAAPRG